MRIRNRNKKQSCLVRLFLSTAFLFLILSCSNTKFIADNDKLYTWTWYKWKGKKNIEHLPFKVYDVVSTGSVRTNWNYVTFSRSGLAIYNYWQPSGTWGLRHYMWDVFSKPPVLYSKVKPEQRLLKIQQSLFDRGHFDSSVDLNLKYSGKNKKKVKGIYTITFRNSYHFRSYNYYANSHNIDKLIRASLKDSYIKEGDEYWIKMIEKERKRVSDLLQDNGYCFFRPNHLIFDMDTTLGNKQIEVALRVKKDLNAKVKQQYSVNTVGVYFKAKKDSISDIKLEYDSTNNVYFQKQNYFKQKYVNRAISLLDDSLYKLENRTNTVNYISGLGIFKIVETAFSIDSTKQNSLNAHVFLEPIKPVSTSLEVNFVTKSNDFLGPTASLAISHANIFKGAEKLSLQLDGGLEWQKRSKRKEYELGLNSYEIGVKTILDFPRFLLPFKLKQYSKKYVPRTYIIAGYKMIKRVKYYRMTLSQINFGYKWNKNENVAFKVEPATINFIKMLETSPEFTDYLQDYPSVSRSFDEQLIVGSTYGVTMQKHSKNNIFKNYYNHFNIDLAGNILNALTPRESNSTGNPDKIFDVTYSQYFKLTEDFRYYLTISPNKQFVTRILAGVGVPYNNSTVLPYIKQFFAGGSNDLRAFYARTVGPGSYKKEPSQGNLLLDQSGEIKLIGNIEYRFPISYKLNGAVFLDAGNVWLLNEDTSRVGGKFNTNSFYKEFAVGAGLGARIDLDYVIIRLDISVPFRRPYKEKNTYWTFTSPHFISDYILSFAIGYPF